MLNASASRTWKGRVVRRLAALVGLAAVTIGCGEERSAATIGVEPTAAPTAPPSVPTGPPQVDMGGGATAKTPAPTTDAEPSGWFTFPKAPLAGRRMAVATVADGELLVWGGGDYDTVFRDGAAWSIASSSWRLLEPAPIAARERPIGVWSGIEWLVVGGVDNAFTPLLDGAAYDPEGDSWRMIAPLPFSVDSVTSGAAWTGTELVVAGAAGVAAYDPEADSWRLVAVEPDVIARLGSARQTVATWTGTEILIVTIIDGQNVTVDRLEPTASSWGAAVTTPAPGLATGAGGVVWTGETLLVIGHSAIGARFDPASAAVEPLSPSGSGLNGFPAVVVGEAATVGDRWLDLDTQEWHDAGPGPELWREFPVAAGDGSAAFWWGGDACGTAATCVALVDPQFGLGWRP